MKDEFDNFTVRIHKARVNWYVTIETSKGKVFEFSSPYKNVVREDLLDWIVDNYFS